MSQSKLLSILGSLISALAIAAFSWTWQMNVEVKLLRAELTQMRTDQRRDQMQDDHIKSLWRYTGWLHEQVDALRFKQGMPPAVKPNLE